MSRHEQPQEEDAEQASRPSRYRSLRKQISAPAPSDITITTRSSYEANQQHENTSTNSIPRSMSRYRRRATSVSAADNNATQTTNNNTPPVPVIPPLLKAVTSPAMPKNQDECVSESSPRRPLRHTDTKRRTSNQPIDDDRENPSNITHDRNRNRTIMVDQDVQHRSLERRGMGWEAERDRLLEEQKKKDLQRLEEQLANSQKVTAQSHKLRSPVVEKFVLLARGGKSKDGLSPTSPTTTTFGRSSTQRSGPEVIKNPPAHIEPGGKGIVPQKDAPTSAINAGDRSVTIRCRHHTFSLPVTPETTTVDIIAQTSSKMAYDLEISPETCLVVEQYGVLGLERRLRRYERIRDVMNSWDGDAQNSLAIVLADPSENLEDLDVGSVPDGDDAPEGCQLYMYHSNRPGKWNKRWITLLDNGQIVCAKKPNVNTAGKDIARLCHLSDYDIYTPTESQMRRHIKPPKRFCFAVKSQHKTTMFLNTENYVQYFSTEDSQVGRQFKQKVHGWRSWYLVDRRPEARKKHTNPAAKTEERSLQSTATSKPTPKKSDNVTSVDGHRLRVSVDELPYTIGQFEPLIDITRFDKRLSQFGKDFLPPQQDPTTMRKVDQNIGRRLSKREKPDQNGRKRDSEEGFTGGLLGEGYENRKQALVDPEKKKRPQDLAFTEGPSLLNSQQDPELSMDKPESPSWFPSALEHTAKQRTVPHTTAVRPSTSVGALSERHYSLNATTRRPTGLTSSTARPSTQHSSQHPHSNTQPHPHPLGSQPTGLSHSDRRALPKPLVDLTPTIQEPPQWSKDKKGHGIKPPEGLGHLINFISVGDGTDGKSSGHLEPPPRSTFRRPSPSGPTPLTRTRSKSSAPSPSKTLLGDIPPVPSLPPQLGPGVDGDGRRLASAHVAREGRADRRDTAREKEKEQGRAKLREREREQRDRERREREAAYNAVPGRVGTLKVV
ncbi:hypothetical protein HD806DRAFT_151700 [Xylariaceae sp. AK1471]|nr:hypothetical protein HD806DRAFT_151700 [Xylariaceae sp. AK1471]